MNNNYQLNKIHHSSPNIILTATDRSHKQPKQKLPIRQYLDQIHKQPNPNPSKLNTLPASIHQKPKTNRKIKTISSFQSLSPIAKFNTQNQLQDIYNQLYATEINAFHTKLQLFQIKLQSLLKFWKNKQRIINWIHRSTSPHLCLCFSQLQNPNSLFNQPIIKLFRFKEPFQYENKKQSIFKIQFSHLEEINSLIKKIDDQIIQCQMNDLETLKLSLITQINNTKHIHSSQGYLSLYSSIMHNDQTDEQIEKFEKNLGELKIEKASRCKNKKLKSILCDILDYYK